MKIKEGYLLNELVGTFVVVAVGKRAKEFNGMINLNETGAFIWRKIEEGLDVDKIAESMTAEYEVDLDTAKKHTEEFIQKLQNANILE